MKNKREKIGLVLNGGIARAFFQVGVIKSLSNYIDFDIIVGSGTGALFAAVLASNLSFDKEATADYFLNPEKENNWAFFNNQKLIELFLGTEKLEFGKLNKKLVVVATDLEENKEVIIDRGNIKIAVEGSIAFPCFNKPVLYEGKFLADGSIINPFPTDVAWSHGADKIIAIDTISQHIRDFDENNVPISPFIENAAIAFPQMWLLHKKKIPWMEMRMFETSLTSAIDDFSIRREPYLVIKLEEEAPELARKTYLDSFENIPQLIKEGIKAGEKYAKELAS